MSHGCEERLKRRLRVQNTGMNPLNIQADDYPATTAIEFV
jgi:hypothetical protein